MNQKGFETVVRTNLVGGFLMSREVFKQSMKQHGGSIVNITADFQRGMPMMSHSGAARAAMDNFTKTAAIEWASHGVRVNAVGPGFIASSGYDTYGDDEFRHTIAKLREWTLLKRDGTEAEVSSAVTFLLSDGAAYITGVSIPVDGGAPLISVMMPNAPHDRSKPFNPFHRSVTPAILKG
jgi:citronellol/citronellal dehydrogenase